MFLIKEFCADPLYASNQGTPFLKAVGANNMEVVDWMVEQYGEEIVKKTDLNGVNALYYAVFRGNLIMVQKLINLGIDPT